MEPTWESSATIATFLTLDDIASTSVPHPSFAPSPLPTLSSSRSHPTALKQNTNLHSPPLTETPVIRLVADARTKGYAAVFLPLTTASWRRRWVDMCLVGGGEGDKVDVEQSQRKSVNMDQRWSVHEKEKGRKREKEAEAEAWRSRPCFLPDEVTITRLDEAEGITAMISDWLELDAEDDWVRHDAEIALQQELAYASYLNIQSAVLPAPRNRAYVASYARIVNACLKNSPYIYLSVRLPVYDPGSFTPSIPPPQLDTKQSTNLSAPNLLVTAASLVLTQTENSRVNSQGALNATWEMWDLIRSVCDYNPRLTLTLDLSPVLPSTLGVLSKWAAESVRNIFLPSSTFIANMKGYPVLPKPTQNFIRDSMIHRPTIILADVATNKHSRGGEPAYSQYIRHLEKTSPAVQAASRPGTVENFAQGYQDYLQAPLQPLMDNLQSVTYQTFEQDPVKYTQYEEAVYRALLDWREQEKIILCVAGAGRGPLIARCLQAIERSRRVGFVYAVEKNPNAYVTLQQRKQNEWGPKVELIFGDMRTVVLPEKVDILVSELLGSFGDNELSPECLDGAVRFLGAGGISIPSSYTAHLAPLSSSKLYNEARASKLDKSLETPYVVMFQAVNILSATNEKLNGRCGSQIQECWEFEHPRKDPVLDARGLPLTNSHNARSAKLRFYIPHAGILHGLAGYFEAVLYKHVGLSIHPHRKDHISKDMLSWFPLFFPFKEPLYLPSNSELQVSIWRLTNERQVWYEWHAESFLDIPVMNVFPTSMSEDSAPGLSPFGSSSSASAFGSVGAPSPSSEFDTFSDNSPTQPEGEMDPGRELVKIGHTSLHNPGGRSSWIGL